MKAVIKVKGLSKRYGKLVALSDLNFDVREGMTACFGVNGSGKTTLVKLMAGVMRPSKGHVEILGERVQKNYLPDGVGVAFEKPFLPPYICAIDFLRRVCDLKRSSEEDMMRCIKLFRIEDIVWKKIGTLSQGNQKRVGIVQAFIGNPRVIILDDPFANLDINYTLFLEDLLNDYMKENSATVFVTTHFMLTLKPSDYMVLQQGKIVAKEKIEKIPVGKPIRYHIRFGTRHIVIENHDEALKLIRKGAKITKIDTYEYVDWIKDVIAS